MTGAGPGDLERPSCPLCGPGTPQRPRHAFPPYGVVECASCSLLFLSPRPTEARAPRPGCSQHQKLAR